MATDTSILLGNYFDDFVLRQVKTGRFNSASEVVRAALRLFEEEENKKEALVSELEKGEKSGFLNDFNKEDFLKELHNKHIVSEI